jgi:hypothetical protein
MALPSLATRYARWDWLGIARCAADERGDAGARGGFERSARRSPPEWIRAALRLRLVLRDSGRHLVDELVASFLGCPCASCQPSIRASGNWKCCVMGDCGQVPGCARDRSTAPAAQQHDSEHADPGNANGAAGDHRNAHHTAANHHGACAQRSDRGAEPAARLLYFSSGVSCCFAHSTSSFNVCTV